MRLAVAYYLVSKVIPVNETVTLATVLLSTFVISGRLKKMYISYKQVVVHRMAAKC